jgi:serine/threonine-protein kinase
MLMPHGSPTFGEHIGRYQLVAELARGGMGIVYVAVTQGPAGFSKLVALKELRPELVEDPDALAMFLDEARLAARLTHPNIVLTQDVSENEGRHFIAMEYLEGRSLNQVLRRFAPRGGLPHRLALTVLRDVLSALDYAHALTDAGGRPLGFVHRDVSPHNVIVTYDGHTKVIDFGIAKARDSSLETRTGVFKGRASYMAPEQLTQKADRRTDLFAVGVILFEVATGRRLWHGMTDLEMLGCLTRGDVPGLSRLGEEVPEPLRRIVKTALAVRPEGRYSTAAEMRDALDEYLWATGGPPRPKEIGALVSREFDVERHRIRAVVDASLARLAEGGGGELETLAPADPRDGSRRTGSIPGSTNGSDLRVGFDVLSPAPQGPKTKILQALGDNRLMIGAALLGVAFLITMVTVALRRDPAPRTEPVVAALPAARPAAALPTVTALPSLAAPATIRLSVSVSPAAAEVLIDGEPMPSNPFLGSFPRSTTMHRVRATAQGYEPKERLVSFDEDVMLDLNLTPRSTPASSWRAAPAATKPPPAHAPHERPPVPPTRAATTPPPTSAPPPPRSTAPLDIQPRTDGERPRRRVIDTANPYGDDK